jgi:choline dehydrogenase
VRGQKQDYDHWAQMGNRGWGWDDVLPLFKRSESHEDGASDLHGGEGGLSVSRIRAKSEIAEAFIDAAVEMGVPRTEDYNGASQEGAGYFHQTARGVALLQRARLSASRAKGRKNLTSSPTPTRRADLRRGRPPRVRGVNFSREGKSQTVWLREGGEVILSAGAIGSPQILELSGIGQGQVLQDAGVEVRHELPGVGECLQDHLQIRLVYEVNVPTLNDAINLFLPRIEDRSCATCWRARGP